MAPNIVALMLVMDLGIIIFMLIALIDSWNEKENRAVMISAIGFLFHIILGPAMVLYPSVQQVGRYYFGFIGILSLLMLIPGPTNERALKGTMGYVVGDVKKVDERDIVFSRNKLKPGSKEYDAYYEAHPELEEMDKTIRDTGVLSTDAGIDRAPMNLAMMHSSFVVPRFLAEYAVGVPVKGRPKPDVTTEEATEVVKNFAKHLGACVVGVCEVNPNWVYSKRGEIHFDNWDDWGSDIPELPKYAVVFAVEMNFEHVMAAPHTPTVAESANRYAEGAYISTVLSQWFKDMGYTGIAQHLRHYDVLTTALAVDAGLGELGRQGYLITPKQGPRTRVFATLTDMPLLTDKPISFGVEEYCTHCGKCATTCPSNSIPLGEKTVHNGVEKWKLDALTCYQYWSQVGTDCAICMAACSFCRPYTPLHMIVKWFVNRKNPIALRVFPHIDDLFYGKDWKPRKVSSWLKYD
jgi:reductive dehalogenase